MSDNTALRLLNVMEALTLADDTVWMQGNVTMFEELWSILDESGYIKMLVKKFPQHA